MEGVRAATAEDVQRLVELTEELFEWVGSLRGGSLLVHPDPESEHRRSAHQLVELLGDPRYSLTAGTVDQVVVGFSICHFEDLPAHGRRGVLDALFVEPDARGVGVGRLLMETALFWFGKQDCGGVDGVALPGDRGAKNFFESAGFKARKLTMYRSLD